MTHDPGTTTSDEGSPLTRPGFLVAGVVVLVIAALGVFLAVQVAGNDDTTTPPPASTSPQNPSEPAATTSTPVDPDGSVCGLPAGTDTGPLTAGPSAAWDYEGVTAYPTSPEFGPADTAGRGYRYCFQHSPTGALFATANALALPEAPDERNAWIEYFVSRGPNRTQLLDTFETDPSGDPTGVRLRVVGFKMLAYEGSTARVDVAVEASGSGETVVGSYVYELIWQEGDWKLNSEAPTPFNFSTVANTAGYVPWGG